MEKLREHITHATSPAPKGEEKGKHLGSLLLTFVPSIPIFEKHEEVNWITL